MKGKNIFFFLTAERLSEREERKKMNRGQREQRQKSKNPSFVVVSEQAISVHDFVGSSPPNGNWPKQKPRQRERHCQPSDENISMYSEQTNKTRGLADRQTHGKNCIINSIKQKLNQNVRGEKSAQIEKIISSHVGQFSIQYSQRCCPLLDPALIYFDLVGGSGADWRHSDGGEQLKTTRPAAGRQQSNELVQTTNQKWILSTWQQPLAVGRKEMMFSE